MLDVLMCFTVYIIYIGKLEKYLADLALFFYMWFTRSLNSANFPNVH